jgi:hypothetical protein
LSLVIEVLERKSPLVLPPKHYIRDRLKSFTFSDTIVIYSVADEDMDLRAIVYLCNEILRAGSTTAFPSGVESRMDLSRFTESETYS